MTEGLSDCASFDEARELTFTDVVRDVGRKVRPHGLPGDDDRRINSRIPTYQRDVEDVVDVVGAIGAIGAAAPRRMYPESDAGSDLLATMVKPPLVQGRGRSCESRRRITMVR